MTGVSIGFRPLADGVKMLPAGGMHLLKTEICELSLVTIPANVETTIHSIKSFDAPHLAASGLTRPASRACRNRGPRWANPPPANTFRIWKTSAPP